ncbi:hypothetical protein GQX74_005373 [Glossina fuscipes]|nr:hypothetical protein GQX74_005373 [Glossina fuscipes]
MDTECPTELVEEAQKDVSIDSLYTDFFPYNISKDSQNYDHAFDKRSHLLREQLEEKLQEPTVEGGAKSGKTGIELQLEKSDARLEDLLSFGNELVNNIKIYNEKQEVIQTQSKTARFEDLQEALNREAEESLKNFNKISEKWGMIMHHKEPMVVNEQLERQKEAIFQLFQSKDEMIERCQKELKRVNEKYLADQTKQSADIYFLIERIDNQIELMKRAYKENIYELQNTIDNEREKFQDECNRKWNDLYFALTVKEQEKQETVKEKQQFYANKLENIIAKQEEITRTTKVRLEKDAEIMELEIRKTRANVLLNSEKIDYNYQVLQKRNEENVIINNQQKRRVAKLNENIVAMKRRLIQLKRNNKQIMNHLSDDIHKLHGHINDMHSKAENFRRANVKKFHKIWDINFKEVKEYFASIMEIDRILYEQQLVRDWERPDIDLHKLQLIKVVKHCAKPAKSQKEDLKKKKMNYNHLHDILKKISDRAGFLVESKLFEILKPYTDEDKCLVRIENIFAALRITDITVVENLVKYFEPFSYCPNCSKGVSMESLKAMYAFRSVNDENEQKENFESYNEQNLEAAKNCHNHYLVMEPALVLTALNEFTSDQTGKRGKPRENPACEDDDSQLNLLKWSKEEIENYWHQFDYYLAKDKQNVWKTIEHGLNHYLEVLKKREQIDHECMFLEKQNLELKYLLQKL